MTAPTLRAGPLSAVYHEGSLRYIRAGGREVLRRVLVTVRDGKWRTIPGRILHEDITAGDDHFRIVLKVAHLEGDVNFEWSGAIEGGPDGTIRWSMSGEALRPFWKNRVGFCVLHPIAECAGLPCEVEHTDGSFESSRFPELVAPHQPFFDVRALSYEALPGVQARVEMTGDTFETEDQRNWSDASFKTYCTPLSVPFPERIQPGELIRQNVELNLSGSPEWRGPDTGPVNISVDRSKRVPVPAIVKFQQFSFVEWNRNRDVLRWVIDPRTHAEDELTMVENLAGQAPMVRTARSVHGDRPIHLSIRVPPIRSAAGWVAISIRELAYSGAAALSYDAASPVLDHLREAKPSHAIGCRSGDPLRCDALVLATGAWIVNFTESRQDVVFDGASLTLEPFELRHRALENRT